MKYLIPTIDVEAIRTLSVLGSFDELIMGKINSDYFGVPKILELLNNYNGSGTFYVDFAEIGHGVNKLKYLSDLIRNEKSDIQLHIHPQFCADKNRYLLNQYSYKEQVSIFDKCIDIFKQCNNEYPVSFRAGGYSADENTLKVLKEKHIKIDSSFFLNHKWCKLNKKPINNVSGNTDLIEIPVTIFNDKINYKLCNLTIQKINRIKKFDIDGCNKEELQKSLDQFSNAGINIVILFMHSYSLLKWNYNYTKFGPDYEDIDRLDFILNYASKKNYKITSVKEISNILPQFISSDDNIIPEIQTTRSLINSSITTTKKKIRKILRGR